MALEVEYHVPVVGVGEFAKTYAVEGVVEAAGNGAGLAVFRDDMLLAGIEVVNFSNGGTYGGGAACGGFLESGDFGNVDVAAFNFQTHVAGKLHKRCVGDGGEDGV